MTNPKAKALRKQPIENQPPAWQEWDFRTISPQEVEFAVRYEYCRQRKELREEAQAWYGDSIGHRLDSDWRSHVFDKETLGARVSCKVKDLLHDPDDDVRRIVRQMTPMALDRALGPMAFHFPEFPAAFLTIDPKVRLQRVKAIQVAEGREFYFDTPLRIEERPWVQSHTLEGLRKYEARLGVDYCFARIDWGWSKKAIKDQFAAWLDERERARRDVQGAPMKKSKGKAGGAAKSSAPFSKLKWLATRRLHEGGFRFEASMMVIRDRMAKHQRADLRFVLPDFKEYTGWNNAVTDCRQYEKQLFETGRKAKLPIVYDGIPMGDDTKNVT